MNSVVDDVIKKRLQQPDANEGKTDFLSLMLEGVDQQDGSKLDEENIRYQLLSGHYRTKINFSKDKKHQADKVLHRLSDFKDRVTQQKLISNNSSNLPDEFYQFCAAMDDDLDALQGTRDHTG